MTYSQLAALLALLIDALTHTLYPPVPSQWFLSDVTLGLHKAFNSLFNHLLSAACPLNLTARVKVFSTLISSAIIFCEFPAKESPAFTEQFSYLTFRLLQFRVSQDSESVCNEFDQIVLKAIDLQSKVPAAEAASNEVVRLLCAESSEQVSVRVVLISTSSLMKACQNLFQAYLRAVLPRASERLLRNIKQALSNDDDLKTRYEALLADIEQCDARTREMRLDAEPSQAIISSAHWRQRVRVAIEALVDFQRYSWMEICDTSDNLYALHNLRQVEDYFKEFVYIFPARLRDLLSTSGHLEASQIPRDEVVEKVTTFLCVLTRCHELHCTGETRYIDISALSDIIESILRGPTGQVTTANRRQAYNIVGHGIRHHSDGTSSDDWSRARQIVLKGVVDKDRSVRLAAG